MRPDPRRDCVRRARWYVTQIASLERELVSKPARDNDDVEQCLAMLREIRARFRADGRPPAAEPPLPELELRFRAMLADANAALAIPAGSRPVGRWRELLAGCRGQIERFAAQNGMKLGRAQPPEPATDRRATRAAPRPEPAAELHADTCTLRARALARRHPPAGPASPPRAPSASRTVSPGGTSTASPSTSSVRTTALGL